MSKAQILNNLPAPTDTDTSSLTAVIEAIRQLSSEIEPDRLACRLLDVALAHIPAQRGLLLLNQPAGWVVKAEGYSDSPATVQPDIPLAQAKNLPLSFIKQSIAQETPLILSQAGTAGYFADDSYISRRSVQSLLVAPLRHQNQNLGLLYLENAAVVGAFTEAHQQFLALLAPQAAIFIEKAQLYHAVEQKVLERTDALNESERVMRTLFSNMPGMAYRCNNDQNWTMEFISGNCLNLTGYPPEAFLKNARIAFADLVHPQDRQQLWKKVQRALQENRPFEVMYRLIDRSGREKWMWEQGRGLFDDTGQIVALEGFINEITAQKQAEALIQQKNRELAFLNRVRQALNSSLDLDYVLQMILKEMHGLLEFTAASFWQYLPEPNRLICRQASGPHNQDVIGHMLRLGQGITGSAAQRNQTILISDTRQEPRHYRKVDEQTGLEIRSILSVPLQAQGAMVGVLNLVDTTANRFSQNDLKLIEPIAAVSVSAIENAKLFEETQEQRRLAETHQRELAKTLETLKNTQDQLIHKEKMASLGELTAGIAHEIKNPLNFVNNFAAMTIELVQELKTTLQTGNFSDTDNEQIAELLVDLTFNAQEIQTAGKRADQIVRGMLLHSRGKSGKLQKSDINHLLEEAAHLTYHSMRAKHKTFSLKLHTYYDATLPQIDVIPQDLSRAVVNIISNAYDATREKQKHAPQNYKPTVMITTKNLNGWIKISIHDNGPGLSAEDQRRIFNPFFTTKPAGYGTGLGLSITYDVITRGHHGQIDVHSQEGEFTEFIIYLPKQRELFPAP